MFEKESMFDVKSPRAGMKTNHSRMEKSEECREKRWSHHQEVSSVQGRYRRSVGILAGGSRRWSHLVRKQKSPWPIVTPFQILYLSLLGRDKVSSILSLDPIFASVERMFGRPHGILVISNPALFEESMDRHQYE